MVAITKFIYLALTATAATAAAVVRRDAITVQNDITQKIGPSWHRLDNDINGFPASGLTGAVTIHQDFTDVIVNLNGTTSDIKSTGTFGLTDGTAILAELQQQIPLYLATLVTLSAEAPSWSAIPGGQALILSDLQSANASMTDFMNTFTVVVPLLLKPGAIAIQVQVTGAFATAIAAFSV
ncbi:hypothetical protein V8C35DRAFT_308381 [Trichoderma chlorosporum]